MERSDKYLQYTTDYISGVMSLRKPQVKSLEILKDILIALDLKKNIDLQQALKIVNSKYPICSDFERNFVSLTFALATGVGKTRLMGAFIAYLYTNYNIKNFFIVAPNTTIYEKLKNDLSNSGSEKYVFKGLGCFVNAPIIIKDDDYRDKTLNIFESDVRIFIYNIDKFNKEGTNMRRANEIIGDSFFNYLSNLQDLVVIMDESHHYRAKSGMAALNELNPILGLELTATPLVSKGNQQIPFKNVVYEYPLSKAIEDGYTRTPFAVTRSDINFYNFGDESIDKLMLLDGIKCHEHIKQELEEYAFNSGSRKVKPFMLVVCKDTSHAQWVESYIKSSEFYEGKYKYKTLMIHSKQKSVESEENTRLLLDVEKYDNPVEIVIHVNMLKEGWDVNNLYTIVPLRTATSKILREQMVGRGLRLPYGVRTGNSEIDSVMLTAHDKFKEILEEAQRGDSIFKAGNVIKAENLDKDKSIITQLEFDFRPEEDGLKDALYKIGATNSDSNKRALAKVKGTINEGVRNNSNSSEYQNSLTSLSQLSNADRVSQKLIKDIEKQSLEDADLGELFKDYMDPLKKWIRDETERKYTELQGKCIPIPRIKVTDNGVEEYIFVDFDLDLSSFNHVPIQNELLIQNLDDVRERKRVKGDAIDFEGYCPEKVILEQLCKKPEIDYEQCSELIFKLITQLCNYYVEKYSINGMRNIVMMYKKDISEKIYNQMLMHFYCQNGFLQEEVIDVRPINLSQSYSFKNKINIMADYDFNIHDYLFDGIQKGVFSYAKFDSKPELIFARVLEYDTDVIKWLRPAPNEFNITYNHGHKYEPDFVVETKDYIYLVEVKGEDKLNDPDVIAKKNRGVQYCSISSDWCKSNGYKEWRYLFIPAMQINSSSSFSGLAKRFVVRDGEISN